MGLKSPINGHFPARHAWVPEGTTNGCYKLSIHMGGMGGWWHRFANLAFFSFFFRSVVLPRRNFHRHLISLWPKKKCVHHLSHSNRKGVTRIKWWTHILSLRLLLMNHLQYNFSASSIRILKWNSKHHQIPVIQLESGDIPHQLSNFYAFFCKIIRIIPSCLLPSGYLT